MSLSREQLASFQNHLDAARKRTDDEIGAVADRIIQENHEEGSVLACISAAATQRAAAGRDHLEEEKVAYEGGATRSAKAERFDLIPPEAEECEAARFGLGAVKHGELNWQNGDAAFIRATINHAKAHINSLMKHGPFHSDDDIGAARCNLGMLAWFRVHKPAEFLKALRMNTEA